MKRTFLCSLMMIFFLGLPGVFAQEAAQEEAEEYADIEIDIPPEENPFDFPPPPPMPVFSYDQLPGQIRNNQYFLESVHYANMAQAAYEEGEYDASIRYSQEAMRYARLSDEFVAFVMRILEVGIAIETAEERMAWAESATVNVQSRFPEDYARAQVSLEAALNAREDESWDDALWHAYDVMDALAYVYEIGGRPLIRGASPLPAQYTVRGWAESGDCFWNIAERPWAYGDPRQWMVLYEANRSKLSDPNNPNVLDPGMVLDIPVIDGETRQGMWSATGIYVPFK